MNNKVIGTIAIVGVILAGIALIKGDSVVVREVVETLGGSAGPEHTGRQYFLGGSTDGSGVHSTTTSGILTNNILKQNKGIYIAATGAGQAALSLTLGATSTMSDILPTKGACTSWWINADDVAVGTTTTIVAGTGWNIVGLDATGAGTGADVIDGNEFGRLTACRENDSDITGYVEEWVHAD